jgi:hypothetical protein
MVVAVMRILMRILLAVLFAETVVVGGWNALAPDSFYRDFPTVDLTPPFSEHYARDFGWALLGISLLLGIALFLTKAHFVIPAALAYSVFAVPHFFFHLEHLDHATSAEAVALTVGNATVGLMALALIPLALSEARRERAAVERSASMPV